MPIFCAPLPNFSGILHLNNHKPLLQNQRFKTRLNRYNSVSTVTRKIARSGSECCSRSGIIRAASSGRNDLGSSFDDDYAVEPFLISFVKEVYSDLRSLVVFLMEQPGQLKYIEWPGFQSTLKTATLTLVLVAMLIVALSSVDSALAYILAWFLRKSP